MIMAMNTTGGKELLVFSLLVEISILCCRQVENFCLFLNTAEAMFLNWRGIQVDFCLRRNPKTSVLLLCRTISLFLNMYMKQLKQLNLSMFWHSSRFLPLLQSVACQPLPATPVSLNQAVSLDRLQIDQKIFEYGRQVVRNMKPFFLLLVILIKGITRHV